MAASAKAKALAKAYRENKENNQRMKEESESMKGEKRHQYQRKQASMAYQQHQRNILFLFKAANQSEKTENGGENQMKINVAAASSVAKISIKQWRRRQLGIEAAYQHQRSIMAAAASIKRLCILCMSYMLCNGSVNKRRKKLHQRKKYQMTYMKAASI